MLRLFFLCLLLAVLLTGCRDDRAWTSADSWYNPPPEDVYPLSGWQSLDYTQIYQVAEDQQPAAEALLREVAVLKITPEQATMLHGKGFPSIADTESYLVRGVFLNPGGFSVHVKGQQLLVSHASLGHSPVPMKRQALVLQLKETPSEVFVTCSMAE